MPEFGSKVIQHFTFMEVAGFCHLAAPKFLDHGVFNKLPFVAFKAFIREQLWNFHQTAAAWVGHNSQCGVAEPVFKLRANNAGTFGVKQFVKNFYEFVDQKIPLGFAFCLQQI